MGDNWRMKVKQRVAKVLTTFMRAPGHSWKKCASSNKSKKGERTEIKNYRPVSILNCFSKVYARFIHENLVISD